MLKKIDNASRNASEPVLLIYVLLIGLLFAWFLWVLGYGNSSHSEGFGRVERGYNVVTLCTVSTKYGRCE